MVFLPIIKFLFMQNKKDTKDYNSWKIKLEGTSRIICFILCCEKQARQDGPAPPIPPTEHLFNAGEVSSVGED